MERWVKAGAVELQLSSLPPSSFFASLSSPSSSQLTQRRSQLTQARIPMPKRLVPSLVNTTAAPPQQAAFARSSRIRRRDERARRVSRGSREIRISKVSLRAGTEMSLSLERKRVEVVVSVWERRGRERRKERPIELNTEEIATGGGERR